MARVDFLLVSEGSSDCSLQEPLEELCLKCGATEVAGAAPDFRYFPQEIGYSLKDKLRFVNKQFTCFDLIFVHRDADKSGRSKRYSEIKREVKRYVAWTPWVPVIPVRMTESWLLLDENAIRSAVGNPNGSTKLDLPTSAREAENLKTPKTALESALITASELGTRRKKKVRKNIPYYKALLISRLDPHGAVTAFPSWQALEEDLASALHQIEGF